MLNKEKMNGYCQTELVSRFIAALVLCFFILIPKQGYPQASSLIKLEDALLELAKRNKMAIVFPSFKVPSLMVEFTDESQSLTQQLKSILGDSKLKFEITDNQILLYKEVKIYGFIEDAVSKDRLIGSTIFIPETGEYRVSNENGFFTLSTRSDSLVLEVSYVGYSEKQIVISEIVEDQFVKLQLDPDNTINEVLITDKLVSQEDRTYIELDKGSNILLQQNQAVTALGGEPDILQALIRQPGISSGADGIGGIHVRGGKNDQNLTLYDGVKMYHSSHGFGMFSTINSSVLDRTELHRSGASGNMFGRLSSVVDLKVKNPNLQKYKSSVQMTTLAGQATFEGPIVKDRVGILVSGRHTYIDPYIDNISKNSNFEFAGEETTGFKFNDFNVKLLGQINTNNRLTISLFQGQDEYTNYYIDDDLDGIDYPFYSDADIIYNWKNRMASITWNTLISSSTFANIQGSAYQYDYWNQSESNNFDGYEGNTESSSTYLSYNAQTTSYDAKIDLETVLDKHHLKYGIQGSYRSYQIGEFVNIELLSMNADFLEIKPTSADEMSFLGYSNLEASIYFSDKFKISNNWFVEAGIYQTVHRSKNDTIPIEPLWATHGYVKSIYRFNERMNVGGSIGSYIQTEHLLSYGDNGYPNDVWVPSTDFIPFQRSNQFELFVEYRHGNHKLKTSAFYKQQKGLIRYPDIGSLPGLSDLLSDGWEFEVELGDATGYGVELDYAYRHDDDFTIRTAYAYGSTEFKFDGLNAGQSFPFDYSLPHTGSIGANFKLFKNWRMYLDWIGMSGRPYTLYSSFIPYSPLEVDGNLIVEPISSENEFRLPAFHKLSAMISTHWKMKKVKFNLSLGVQNMYNRENIIYQYELDLEGRQAQKGFPVLPMFLLRVDL